MIWTELILTVSRRDLEVAEAIATVVAPDGLYIEDYFDLADELSKICHYDYIDPALLEKDPSVGVLHLYLPREEELPEVKRFLTDRLREAGIEHTLLQKNVEESDWAENWKQYYHTQKIGKRLVIRPSWEPYERQAQEAVVSLDPGMSFGTGEHASTRLCLMLLEEHLRGKESVFDAGCGSGILGIAALKLGADFVHAADFSQEAAEIAAENAKKNEVSDRFLAECLDLSAPAWISATQKFDLITANIVADVILRLSDPFFAKLHAGGLLIAGGIIDTREREVATGLETAGFLIKQIERLNGWSAIAAEKPAR